MMNLVNTDAQGAVVTAPGIQQSQYQAPCAHSPGISILGEWERANRPSPAEDLGCLEDWCCMTQFVPIRRRFHSKAIVEPWEVTGGATKLHYLAHM